MQIEYDLHTLPAVLLSPRGDRPVCDDGNDNGNSHSKDNDNSIPPQCGGLGGQLPAADREETTSTPAHSPGAAPSAAMTIPILTGVALVVLVALVVVLGVYPGPLLQVIQQTFGP